MNLKGRDVLSVKDFTKDEVEHIFDLTDKYVLIAYNARGCKTDVLNGKVLATLFFSESTRTQFSYQSAMTKLGGGWIGFAGTAGTSYERGEDFADGIHMYDSFADAIAIRHPKSFWATKAAEVAEKPVINCGDGTNEHPTQMFLEVYAFRKLLGELAGKTITLAGELKGNRVPHSLVYGFAMFNMNIILAAPKGREMPEEITKDLKRRYNAKIREIDLLNLKEVIKESDVLEAIPILRDFFADPKEYKKYHGVFRIDVKLLRETKAEEDLIVYDPMPRRGELARDVDETKWQRSWDVYKFAIPSRMAVLAAIIAGE